MEQMQHMTLPEPGDDAGLHAYLEERIAAIHRDPQFPLPPDAYMNFYSAVWRLMYHDPNADGRNRSAHLMAGAAIAYKNLSAFLAEHLQTVVQRLQSMESSLLLEAYVAEWDRYAAATNRLNRLLELINRHYVLRHIDEGKDGIYKIRTLHFLQWRAHVWDKISGSVIDAVQRTIERGDEKAADLNNILERFASLRVNDSRSFDSDSRGSIRNKLEAAFVPEIEAHDRKIRQLKAAESGYGVAQTDVEG